jgi:hypothetical protein
MVALIVKVLPIYYQGKWKFKLELNYEQRTNVAKSNYL